MLPCHATADCRDHTSPAAHCGARTEPLRARAGDAPVHPSLTRLIDTGPVDFGGAGGDFGPSLPDGLDKTRSPPAGASSQAFRVATGHGRPHAARPSFGDMVQMVTGRQKRSGARLAFVFAVLSVAAA